MLANFNKKLARSRNSWGSDHQMLRAPFFTRGRSHGLLWLFAAIVASGCAINPPTGSNQLMLVSESQEVQMGQQYDSQVVATIGLYPDAAWQRYIQQLG